MDGEHGQRGELAGEGLHRGDADLRTGAGVDHRVGLAGERGARHVADREDAAARAARGPHGAHRVGRLTRLRDRDDERLAVDDRASVPRLGGDVHLDRHAGERLDHVLRGERGVPGGAATEQEHSPRACEQGRVETRVSTQPVLPRGVDERGDRHADRARLLVDFLEHEVRIAILLGVRGVPVDVHDTRQARASAERADTVAPRRQDGHLAVFEDLHVARVRQHRGHVGGQQLTAGARGEDQRGAAVARADDDVRLARRDDGERERALQAADGTRRRLLQRQCAQALDEVDDDLGVGARGEHVARVLQLAPQSRVVLDDAVVDDGQRARAVGVRVGIGVRGLAMGRPARMTDADVRLDRMLEQRLLEIGDLTDPAAHLQATAVDDGEAGRVVAAIFEALEAFDEERRRVLVAHVPDDPAHETRPFRDPGRDGPSLNARSKTRCASRANRREGEFSATVRGKHRGRLEEARP